MLRCEGLTKRYGNRNVLMDCTFSAPPGTGVVIRGPSGGGKSTLLRTLALLEPADAGSVEHDKTLYRYPQPAHRFPKPSFPFLTLVFQQIYLWPNLTIRENIAIVVEQRRSAALKPGALDLLARFNVFDVLDLLPHECSLGQRQRVAVARAILTPARYLLLDEPTSALDGASRTTLIAALAEEKGKGRGLVIVSHDERGLESLADASFDLENGILRPLRSL